MDTLRKISIKAYRAWHLTIKHGYFIGQS
ncbi:hypothetical protein LINPERHAP1_LOCUS35321 [Linum perenne]